MANSQTLDVGPVGAGILSSLAENWWLLLLRGIAAIAFGVLAFIWPGITLLSLTLLWGAYALADGALAIWAAITGDAGDVAPRWWLAVVGVAGILAGLGAFFWPGLTAFVLLIFIASWSIVIGVMQIVGAIQLRREIDGEWLLILSGLLSIAFGAILMYQPDAGALAVVWIIGWYAILAGGLSILLAFRLKTYKSA
jgi:uncharacterized membrane protein HdeD (DUF308 family)